MMLSLCLFSVLKIFILIVKFNPFISLNLYKQPTVACSSAVPMMMVGGREMASTLRIAYTGNIKNR